MTSNLLSDLVLEAAKGNTVAVERLLKETSFDVNIVVNNRTALMQAAYNGHTKTVQAILSHPNLQINMQTELRVTALMMAAYFNHVEIVKLLIARDDIQLNIQDKNEDTALTLAAYKGFHEIVALLLGKPAVQVNMPEKNGKTPLMWAAEGGFTDCVRVLLAAPGINPLMIDKLGNTAIDWAKTEDIKFLISQHKDSQNVWETVQTTMAILQSTVESLTSQIEKERTKTEALELELLRERQRGDQLAVEVQMLKLQNISLSGGGGDSVADPVIVLEEWALDPVMPRTTSS